MKVLIILIMSLPSIVFSSVETDQLIMQGRFGEAISILKNDYKINKSTENAYELGKAFYYQGTPQSIIKGKKILSFLSESGHSDSSKFLNVYLSAKQNFSEPTPVKPATPIPTKNSDLRNKRTIRAEVFINDISKDVTRLVDLIENNDDLELQITIFLNAPGWDKLSKRHIDIMRKYKKVTLDIEGHYSKSRGVVKYPYIIKYEDGNKINVSEKVFIDLVNSHINGSK